MIIEYDEEIQSDEEIEELIMRANELIVHGNLDGAQRKLDQVQRKNARWHFFQSKLFKCRNWTNEARKELETAVELDPDNEDYKNALENLKASAQKDGNQKPKKMMGFFEDLGSILNDDSAQDCCEGCCGCFCWALSNG